VILIGCIDEHLVIYYCVYFVMRWCTF